MRFLDRNKIKSSLNDLILEANFNRNTPPHLRSNTLDCLSTVINSSYLSDGLVIWISNFCKNNIFKVLCEKHLTP